ncbi:MAG: VWA domain-containing protein [Planctomycetota bacterium]
MDELFAVDPRLTAAQPVLHLFGDVSLGAPWFLAAAPLGWIAMVLARRARGAVRAGGLPGIHLPVTLRQRLAFLPPLLRVLSIALFAVALARPLRSNVETADISEGVDILLVVDRSSSMKMRDMEGAPNTGRTRFEVVREVALDFAKRRMTDRGYARDNVGLLAFAGFPLVVCPFTLDYDALAGFAEELRIVDNDAENGTRIGAALAKAVQLLKDSDAKSRVVVLLTDGEENPNSVIEPLEAADLAAHEGIRVHAILAGTKQVQMLPFSPEPVLGDQDLDDSEMRAIAERTGGKFFRARDREQLEGIYAEIEKLERTPREDLRRIEAYDLYAPFLALGIALYALGWVGAATWWRRTLP